MRNLKVDDRLYHASYAMIEKPDLILCQNNRDFGKGFYLTKSLVQAEGFVNQSLKKAKALGIISEDVDVAYINEYKVVDLRDIEEFDFLDADQSWLHFIAYNRASMNLKDVIGVFDKYNVIGGKIANDMTSIVINAYIRGLYGNVGDANTDKRVIEELIPNRLDYQYCFKDEKALKALKFVQAKKVRVGRNG